MKTTKKRLATAIQVPLDESLTFYHTSLNGLTEEQVEKNRDLYGENVITKGQDALGWQAIHQPHGYDGSQGGRYHLHGQVLQPS